MIKLNAEEKKSITALFTEDLASTFYTYFYNKFNDFKPLNKHDVSLLENNGCTCTSKTPMCINSMITPPEYVYSGYVIYYITGMNANKANICLDYAYYRGIKHLFIFLDYFEHARRTPGNPDDELDFGNASMFDQICRIARVFQETYFGLPTNDLLTTIYGNNLRFNPYIIAAFVTNIIRPLEPVDVMGCPILFKDLKRIIQSSDTLINALDGIRWDDEE